MPVIFQIHGDWYCASDNDACTCPECGHLAHGEYCCSLDYSVPKEPWPCSCTYDARKNKKIKLFGKNGKTSRN